MREALDLRTGDLLIYEITGDTASLRRYNPADPFDNPSLTFTEWAGEADRAYDVLEWPEVAPRPSKP